MDEDFLELDVGEASIPGTDDEIVVKMPVLHPDQVRAYEMPGRFKAIRCGRRWGKTDLAKVISCDAIIKAKSVGWFAPDYKISSEAYNDIVDILDPVKKTSSKIEGLIRTTTGGRMDFWTLDNERAGRSRKYHLVVIDEGAFTKPNMINIWEQSILPTLLDYGGEALVPSNPKGVDPENFFWKICNQPELGFKEFHAPTMNNPYIPARLPGEDDITYALRRIAVFDQLKADNHPLVYRQEYLAEFVDWTGVAFFDLPKLLDNGQPCVPPLPIDSVFAIIDTAVKAKTENDGTGCIYFGYNKQSARKLHILDYELFQLEGASLELWLPTVFQNLEGFARQYRARMGSLGAFIEDKSSGSVLIQQAYNKGWPAQAIDSKLTAMGKDERGLNASGAHYRGEVGLTRQAYDKVSTYKGATRNHLIAQVTGFRLGDKDAARRADDLLDCYCYGIAIALGDSEGV